MKIVIKSEFDFTPAGKRRARVVKTSRGGTQLRWYVSGRIYRCSPPAHLTSEWLANAGAPSHRPQPWSAFY